MSAWRGILVGALIVVQGAGGCRWIAGYDPRWDDGGRLSDLDGPRPLADARRTDLRIDVELPGDVGIPTNDAANCPASAPPLPLPTPCGCSGPTDCDGLPAGRDVDDSACNALLWQENFDALDPSKWQGWGAGWSADCGWLRQDAWAQDSYVGILAPAVLPKAHYLLEARLRLGAIGDPADWEVGIVARYTSLTSPSEPDGYISCIMRVDTVRDDVVNTGLKAINPDLKIHSKASGTNVFGAWQLDNPPGLYDPSPGQTYVLQLYFEPNAAQRQIHCVLFDDAGKLLRRANYVMWGTYASHIGNLPTAAGTVGVRSWRRQVSVDYLRVFDLGSWQ